MSVYITYIQSNFTFKKSNECITCKEKSKYDSKTLNSLVQITEDSYSYNYIGVRSAVLSVDLT